MRPLAVAAAVALLLASLVLTGPTQGAHLAYHQRYAGPGDATQLSLNVPGIGVVHVGGVTFFPPFPAGTTQIAVLADDDNWPRTDFIACQDLDGNGACTNNTGDVWFEGCDSGVVTGIHPAFSLRVFVVHSWGSLGLGKCPGGIVGATTGSITITPS